MQQLLRATVIFLIALPWPVHAQDNLPYTTYTSFDELLKGRDARYVSLSRVSDPGTKERPIYTGFFFYQILQFDVTGRYLVAQRVYCENRDVKADDRGDIGYIDLKEGVPQWERTLVNDVCPIDARVSNSGKYVITAGEWYEYEKLPIVLYGTNGSLINAYGKLEQIADTDRFLPERPGSMGGESIPNSLSGWHWLSHSLMLFVADDDYFVVRLRNRDILVFETVTGRLIDDKWKEANDVLPDKIKQFDIFRESLGQFIIRHALKLAASDLRRERDDGLFVLNQCRDRDSMRILQEATRDSTSKIVARPEGRLREYPIRKAAREALKAMGEEVPDSVVTEEKIDAQNEGDVKKK